MRFYKEWYKKDCIYNQMHVAVIGAGVAGLCSARHLTAPNSGFTCVVYEQTDSIGGAWVYTENTGIDKYGLPIGSVMYKNLRTNLPTANMEFPGFPFINSKSFVKHSDVLCYIADYANYYNLMENIKCLHHVKHVTPKNKKWQIVSVNLSENTEAIEQFDAVIVCNGHSSVPYMADFPGMSEFEGEVYHSHSYRTPEPYSNKTVLICGAGPSGIDITFDIAKFASKVYLSHKNQMPPKSLPENVIEVPIVSKVKKNYVEFKDGSSSEEIDTILLCTGYKYSLPFLSPECGITITDHKFVQPLYKDIVNIHHPTMGFIGIPFQTFIFPLFDYQVRFFIKTLKGELQLPSRECMLADLEKRILQNEEKGVPITKYQQLGCRMRSYMEDLANTAQFEHLPPVVYNIYEKTKHLRQVRLSTYRNFLFHKLDDNDFKITELENDEF